MIAFSLCEVREGVVTEVKAEDLERELKSRPSL